MPIRPYLIKLLALAVLVGLFGGCEKTKKTPSSPPPTAGSTLLIANFSGGAGSLSLIDLSTSTVTRDVAGLGNVPNDILYWNNRFYVINSLSNDMNVLEISDRNEVTSIDTIDLGRGANKSPQYGAVTSSGDFYISNFNDHTVTVFDPRTRQAVSYIPVGQHPQDVLAREDKVYVCNSNFNDSTYQYGAGSVSVISTTSNRVMYTLPVGLNPQFLALDGRNRLHVVCSGGQDTTGTNHEGVIYVIDTFADTLAQVINIGGTPGDIAITSDNIAYLAAGGWSGDRYGKVFRYNALTGQILNGPSNPIQVSLGAMRIITGPGRNIYVACFEADRVERILDGEKRDSWMVGDGPGAMAVIER
ncbi:MAG: YncE family protein [bacterium]